jgi:CDP-diacylglycerol--glycerol-3-phosphate 3-phosphatidyltransferase
MKSVVLGITLSRVILGPIIFIFVLFFEMYLTGLLLFFLAAITDYLDGKLARTFSVTSALGAVLDPIADKLLLIFALLTIVLVTIDPVVGLLSSCMLAREIWIAGLREFASMEGKSNATKVTFLAKSKTFTQFVAIAMFYFGFYTDQALIIFLAKFVLLVALLLGLQTATTYTQNVFKQG